MFRSKFLFLFSRLACYFTCLFVISSHAQIGRIQSDPKIVRDDLSHKGSVLGESTPLSLVERSKIPVANSKEIVVYSLTSALGDSVVFEMGQIEYLHQKYPNAKIKFISPAAGLLEARPWLEPVKISMDNFSGPEGLKTFTADPKKLGQQMYDLLAPHIRPGTMVFFNQYRFNLTGADLGRVWLEETIMHDQSLIRYWGGPSYFKDNVFGAINESVEEGIKKVQDKILAEGGSGIGYFDALSARRDYSILNPHVLIRNGAIETTDPNFRETRTFYEQAAHTVQMLHGPDAWVEWPLEIFYDEAKYAALYEKTMQAAFPNSKSPFMVLNLNTRTPFKVQDLIPDYVSRFEAMAEEILKHKSQTHLFIAPVEAPFGPKVAADFKEAFSRLEKKYPGRIALMPSDPATWKPLLYHAKGVISQDAGMLHIANILNAKVFQMYRSNMSSENFGSAHLWRLPNQSSAPFGENDTYFIKKLAAWMDADGCNDLYQKAIQEQAKTAPSRFGYRPQ